MPADTTTMGADAPRTRRGKVRLRSLDQLDGRTASAVRVRQLVRDMRADLGGDADGSGLSAMQVALVTRAAVLAAVIEDMEAAWAVSGTIDLAEYTTALNAFRRLAATIGLDRRPRDVTDLSAYLAARAEAG